MFFVFAGRLLVVIPGTGILSLSSVICGLSRFITHVTRTPTPARPYSLAGLSQFTCFAPLIQTLDLFPTPFKALRALKFLFHRPCFCNAIGSAETVFGPGFLIETGLWRVVADEGSGQRFRVSV